MVVVVARLGDNLRKLWSRENCFFLAYSYFLGFGGDGRLNASAQQARVADRYRYVVSLEPH